MKILKSAASCLLVSGVLLPATQAEAIPVQCTDTKQFSSSAVPIGSTRMSRGVVGYKGLNRRARSKSAASSMASAKALGGETLNGELSGSWDQVYGVLTYPDPLGDPNIFVVGVSLPAQAKGDGQYEVPGWHREGFFLDTGDGVPRLLASSLLDANFVPESDDVLFESGQLWVSEFVLYREHEELERDPDFYQGYEYGATDADLRFVTDDDGKVLQIAIDIYDQFGEYLYSVDPKPGDFYDPGMTYYDLREPNFTYIGYYFSFLQEITGDLQLTREYLVPSGASDPALPSDYDSADVEPFLILEGGKETDDGDTFAYSTPTPLGYTWGEAKSATSGGGSSGALGAWWLLAMAATVCAVRKRRLHRLRA